jgi:hypothetical protein
MTAEVATVTAPPSSKKLELRTGAVGNRQRLRDGRVDLGLTGTAVSELVRDL